MDVPAVPGAEAAAGRRRHRLTTLQSGTQVTGSLVRRSPDPIMQGRSRCRSWMRDSINRTLNHRRWSALRWYFVCELLVVGTLAGLLTAVSPGHPLAAIAATVLAWVALQGV